MSHVKQERKYYQARQTSQWMTSQDFQQDKRESTNDNYVVHAKHLRVIAGAGADAADSAAGPHGSAGGSASGASATSANPVASSERSSASSSSASNARAPNGAGGVGFEHGAKDAHGVHGYKANSRTWIWEEWIWAAGPHRYCQFRVASKGSARKSACFRSNDSSRLY